MSNLPDPARRLLEFTQRIAPTLTRPLYPVCSAENPQRPTLQASSVLFRVANRFFVVTAGHVASLRKQLPLVLLLRTGVVSIAGEWLVTGPPGPQTSDPFDLAVLIPHTAMERELRRNHSLALKHFASLPPDQEKAKVLGAYYLILGFPVSKQPRYLKSDAYEAFVWSQLSSECSAEEYHAANVNRKHHLLLEFDKRSVHTVRGRAVAPDPLGASGGAVWWIRVTSAGFDPRLVAVPIVWRRDAGQILATRAYVALAAIWKVFPELQAILDAAD